MSDKAFFDWFPFAFDPERDALALMAWNAATERATAIERERCARICEDISDKNLGHIELDAAVTFIRQGSDT